jgi:hypothetical protein
LFDASLRDVRIRRLREYLPTIAPTVRTSLLAAMRKDLGDLGIDATRDKLT